MSDWPDVEGAVRTWLRSRAGINAVVGQRVFFGVPKGAEEDTFPLITVQRVGGGADGADAPLDRAMLQIDCWGSINTQGIGLKATATVVVNAVRTELEAVGIVLPSVSGVLLHGANVESVLWLPDPDNDRPRYVVTAEVAALSS